MAGTNTGGSTPAPAVSVGPREGETPVVNLSPGAAAVADELFGEVETVVVDAREAQ